MRIKPFEIHYDHTRALWTKEASDNRMLACVQKICFVVAAAFVAVYETLRNACSLVANETMERWYMREALRTNESVLYLNEVLGGECVNLLALAKWIDLGNSIDGRILITAADRQLIRTELQKKNLTIVDILKRGDICRRPGCINTRL